MMKMQEIRTMAKAMGVMMLKGMDKAEMIRAIQRAEGNQDCFATMNPAMCNQMSCLWRGDCTTIMKGAA